MDKENKSPDQNDKEHGEDVGEIANETQNEREGDQILNGN